VSEQNPWEGFHSAWVNTMVRHLNGDLLPPDLRAIPQADYHSDCYEVQVFDNRRDRQLSAAVVVATPGNKVRSERRKGFAVKCADFLQRHVSVMIVDIVTLSGASLHNELFTHLGLSRTGENAEQYSAAYRLRADHGQWQLDVWSFPLAVDAALPTVPLWLAVDLAVPFDLERTYEETCQVLRLDAE